MFLCRILYDDQLGSFLCFVVCLFVLASAPRSVCGLKRNLKHNQFMIVDRLEVVVIISQATRWHSYTK